MTDVERTVVKTIEKILRAARKDVEVSLDASLYDDLTLDSLDVAELSAVLEDDFGRDPFNEGFEPRTVRQVIAFYDGKPVAADGAGDA
jgi:acyl carrier protein